MTSVGGFCASYSFLARGGVFAFAQTGNIIYSGHVMASGHFLGVLTFLFPILSYMLGLFLSQQLRDRQADLVTFEKIILLFQSLLMTLSALMPDSFAATRLVLCLLGLSSGLQMQTFHRVEGHEYTSIMVMGNMKRTVEAFSAYLKDHETGSLKKPCSTSSSTASSVWALLGALPSQKPWATRPLSFQPCFFCSGGPHKKSKDCLALFEALSPLSQNP